MELIFGLPEETKDSFIEGVCKIMELGQHNYIGIYPLTALPNTPFGEKDYIKKYGLKLKNTYPAFSHIDVSDQNSFEREKMVVGNRCMNFEEYKETTLYRWLFMYAHYLGYIQYIARFLNIYKKISFKEFYLNLMDFSLNSKKSKFLKDETKLTKQGIAKVLKSHSPWGRVIEKVRPNFSWDFEEATAIKIIKNKKIFYEEIKIFLAQYNLKKEILDNLIEFQMNTIIDPFNQYPFSKKFKFNFFETINYLENFKKINKVYTIAGKNYNNNIFEWGKETLWWGRRVAACKAKIREANKNLFIQNKDNFVLESFDKR